MIARGGPSRKGVAVVQGRPATTYDVATLAGVSQATVSVVLNGARSTIRVSELTRRRILDAAASLGYVPNIAAQSLSRQRSDLITAVTYGLDNPYYVDLVMGVQAAARRHGLAVNVVTVDSTAEELQVLRKLPNGSTDGVIDAGGYNAPKLAALNKLINRGLPVVTTWHRSFTTAIPTISVDHEHGGHLATAHLLALGHTRIAHVTEEGSEIHRRELNPVRARFVGYRRALAEAGIGYDRRLLVQTGNSMAGGREAARRLATEKASVRPTALFVLNDLMAVGVLRGLAECGVRVPDDVAVVGYDGLAIGQFTTPGLSTVDFPRHSVGAFAADALVALFGGARVDDVRTVPVRMVTRESCGTAAAAR